MGSVSRQNTRHLHGIEQVINSKLNNSVEQWIEAKSLIVFANDVVEIRNYSDNVVVRASEMVKEIRKYPQCLNEQQIREVADILRQETLLNAIVMPMQATMKSSVHASITLWLIRIL